MSLSIVFDELKTMSAANISNPICIGTTTIKVDNHDSTSSRGDGSLYQGIINLKRIHRGLNEYGYEPVLRNGKDRGDIGVGRHDDLITLMHHPHLDIGSKDQCQRIETVATTDTATSTDVFCILFFELPRGLTFQIPTGLNHTVYCGLQFFLIRCVDLS